MSFALKELLLLKAESEELKQAIQSIPDEIFGAAIIESLQKGGTRSGNRGNKDSEPMQRFAMDAATNPDILDRLKHGLAHHISHYKSALAGKNQYKANKHARLAHRMKNLLNKISEISKEHGGENYIHAEIPDPKYWEMHLHGGQKPTNTNLERFNYGKLSPAELREYSGIDTSQKGAPVIRDQALRPESIGHHDFSHFSAKSVAHPKNPHSEKAYPYEDITVNGEILPIEHNLPMSEKFEHHAMDHDPIMAINDMRAQDITPEVIDWYNKKSEDFDNSDTLGKFHEDLAAHRENAEAKPIRKMPVHAEAKDYAPMAQELKPESKALSPEAPAKNIPPKAPAKQKMQMYSLPEGGYSIGDKKVAMRGAEPGKPVAAQQRAKGGKFGAAASLDQYVAPYKALMGASVMRERYGNDPELRKDLDAEIHRIHTYHPDKSFGSKFNNPNFIKQLEAHPEIAKQRAVHKERHGDFQIHVPKKFSAKPASKGTAKSAAPKAAMTKPAKTEE